MNSSISEENSSVIHYFTSLCDSYVTFLKFLMTYNTSIIALLSNEDFEMILQQIDYFLQNSKTNLNHENSIKLLVKIFKEYSDYVDQLMVSEQYELTASQFINYSI